MDAGELDDAYLECALSKPSFFKFLVASTGGTKGNVRAAVMYEAAMIVRVRHFAGIWV